MISQWLSPVTLNMVGQQYSPEQRNFLLMEYVKRKSQFKFIQTIKDSFHEKYPNAAIPDKKTILRIYKKQNTFSLFTTSTVPPALVPLTQEEGEMPELNQILIMWGELSLRMLPKVQMTQVSEVVTEMILTWLNNPWTELSIKIWSFIVTRC